MPSTAGVVKVCAVATLLNGDEVTGVDRVAEVSEVSDVTGVVTASPNTCVWVVGVVAGVIADRWRGLLEWRT